MILIDKFLVFSWHLSNFTVPKIPKSIWQWKKLLWYYDIYPSADLSAWARFRSVLAAPGEGAAQTELVAFLCLSKRGIIWQ